jgi:PKD repeat protein
MKTVAYFFIAFSFLIIRNALAQDTLILQPGPEGKDAYINNYYYGNYGDYPNMFAIAGTSSGDPFTSRSLFEFDLSMIPPGSAILAAKLSLYFANNTWNPYYHYGDNKAWLQRVIAPWDEYTVTWWNQPQTTEQNQVSLPASHYETQDYVNIDVKLLIQDIVNDPENSHGILFRLQIEEIYRRMFFASSDYVIPGKRPKLEIIHIGCAVPTVEYEYQADSLDVSFTGISPTAISWHWDFGDGDTSDVQNPEHYYQQPGFYNVCLRVEDTCYFAEYCEEIEICIAPPISGFTYAAEGLAVSFQDNSIMAAEYYWDFGDGYFSSLINPSHIYDLNGDYLVCLTTWNSCGADTTCEMIEVCSPPVAGFTFEMDGLLVYFEDLSIMAEEYYWDFGDGYYSNLANPWHQYESLEDYQVCLTTWNDCGADTACEVLFFSTVSVAENFTANCIIYPNPACDLVFVKPAFTGSTIITLHDLSGKVIFQQNMDIIKDEITYLPLNQVGSGIYILRINSGDTQYFGKLVVAK